MKRKVVGNSDDMPSKPSYDASDSQPSESLDSLTGAVEELGITSVSGSSNDDGAFVPSAIVRKSERVAKKEDDGKKKEVLVEEHEYIAPFSNSLNNIVSEEFVQMVVGSAFGDEPYMEEDRAGAKYGKPKPKKKVLPMLAVAGCIFKDFKQQKFAPQNCMFAYDPKCALHKASVEDRIKSIIADADRLRIECERFDFFAPINSDPITQVAGISKNFTTRRFPPTEQSDWATGRKKPKPKKKAKVEIKVN